MSGICGDSQTTACCAPQGLPKFTCLPEARGQHNATTHLLPDEAAIIPSITRAFADAQAGRLPDFPTIEWCEA